MIEVSDRKTTNKQKKTILSKLSLNKKTAPYYFLSPILILFCIFFVYPIFHSLILSLTEFDAGKYTFVGLNNYKRLIHDPTFIIALKNTIIYLILQVPPMIILALIFAVVLDQKFLRAKGFFRVSIFLPAVTGLVAYSLVFKLLFNLDYGLINKFIELLRFQGVDWLNRPISAKLAVMISVTWRWTGYNMIIMIAGLQGISKEIYEACEIDGASKLQAFLYITIPLMKPIILFCAITSTIGTLQLFDQSYILTKGGPDNATITIVHYLYNEGFRSLNLGYAAAMSYILVVLTGVLSIIQFILGKDGSKNG